MRTKYGAVKTEINGIKFDSKAEGRYYLQLLSMEKSGLIKIINLQPKIYMTLAKILYKPDFEIEESGRRVFIDIKGMTTAVFAIKARLWLHYGRGTLRLVKNGKIIKEINAVKNTDHIESK